MPVATYVTVLIVLRTPVYVGGVSIRSRNGAPSRTGCVVDGQMTWASNK